MIRCVLLHTASAITLGGSALSREFPSVAAGTTNEPARGLAVIAADAWDDDAQRDFAPFERAARAANLGGTLSIVATARTRVERVTHELLTRFQRYLGRRNEASATRQFDSVLRLCAALHRADVPRAVSARDHALDAWQWVLRLDPWASFEVQVAALFHDVERIVAEPDPRRPSLVPEETECHPSQRGSARIAERALAALSLGRASVDRIAALVSLPSRRRDDAERALLSDADALSFFSLNSAGYADCFGPARTRAKIRSTLAELGPARRPLLARMKLRRDVRAIIVEELSRLVVSSRATPA